MPEIPYLSAAEVFAVRCLPDGDRLKVGILLLGEDFEPGNYTLYPESGAPITVSIAQESGRAYNVELSIVHVLPV